MGFGQGCLFVLCLASRDSGLKCMASSRRCPRQLQCPLNAQRLTLLCQDPGWNTDGLMLQAFAVQDLAKKHALIQKYKISDVDVALARAQVHLSLVITEQNRTCVFAR